MAVNRSALLALSIQLRRDTDIGQKSNPFPFSAVSFGHYQRSVSMSFDREAYKTVVAVPIKYTEAFSFPGAEGWTLTVLGEGSVSGTLFGG